MKNSRVKNMALISMCTAFICISAWITVPFAVNFTLQTFAVFLVCSLFDLKISLVSILLYMALGICGLPVFSGFGAGFGVLFGPTGGYLVGFVFVPAIMYIFLRKNRMHAGIRCISMCISLFVCYLFGSLWYYFGFSAYSDITFAEILAICILPFIFPDILKIILACSVSSRLMKINFK